MATDLELEENTAVIENKLTEISVVHGPQNSFSLAPAFGEFSYEDQAYAVVNTGCLQMALPLRRIVDTENPTEFWQGESPLGGGQQPLTWSRVNGFQFTSFIGPDGHGEELEKITLEAFRQLLSHIEQGPCSRLLRVWCIIPHINQLDQGLERYQRFCRARAEAFEEHYGAEFETMLCASSGVGGFGDQLVILMLSGERDGVHLENPRQTPAWKYPTQFGPRSPSFARATALGSRLFVSGTASIVNTESKWPGDLEAQLQETLTNIEVLLNHWQEGREESGPPEVESLKVFLRNPTHASRVQDQLNSHFNREVPAIYLHADICRPELLVEIEGVFRSSPQ